MGHYDVNRRQLFSLYEVSFLKKGKEKQGKRRKEEKGEREEENKYFSYLAYSPLALFISCARSPPML
jgi:hypothetical protein